MSRGRVIVGTEFKRIGDFTLHAYQHNGDFSWAVFELSNRIMSGAAHSLAEAKRFAIDAFKQWRYRKPRMLFNQQGWIPDPVYRNQFKKRIGTYNYIAHVNRRDVTGPLWKWQWWVTEIQMSEETTLRSGLSKTLAAGMKKADQVLNSFVKKEQAQEKLKPKMLFNSHDERYVDAAMKDKGYRYKLIPRNKTLDPLYAKSVNQIAVWLKEFPKTTFDIIDLSTGKTLKSDRRMLFNVLSKAVQAFDRFKHDRRPGASGRELRYYDEFYGLSREEMEEFRKLVDVWLTHEEERRKRKQTGMLFNSGSGGMGYDLKMGRWYKLERGSFKKWAMYLPEGRIEVKWHPAGTRRPSAHAVWTVYKGLKNSIGLGSDPTMEGAARLGIGFYKRQIGEIPKSGKIPPRMLFNPALAEKWDRMTRAQRISLLRLVGVLPEAVDNIANQPWASVPFAVKMKLKWAWRENGARNNSARRWEIEMLTKGDAKKLRKWWHGHTGRSYRIYRSERHRKFFRLVRENYDDPRFEKLAHAQRGKPESAMMRLSMAQISQLYGAVAEHVGDLTHRMSQQIGFFKGGYQWVSEKVNKTLRWLTNAYGFEREVREQVATNFEYMKELQAKGGTPFPKHYGKSPQDALLRLKRLGRLYAAEHRKLPVFNAVQRIARDAAIAVGEWRFKDAVDRLRSLKYLLDQGPDAWSREAMKTKNNPRPKNPWAICTAAVGRKDPAKYERCVRGVKAKMNPGKMQREIVQAFLAHRPKRIGLTTPMHGGTRRHRYSTDGESLYVWGNEVAYHRSPRTVGIVDAGWRTMLTRNVLNEVLRQLGLGSRIWTQRGKWVIDGQEWTGSAVIHDGRLTMGLPGAAPPTRFGGYSRRGRTHIPLSTPKPRMLFNAKSLKGSCQACGKYRSLNKYDGHKLCKECLTRFSGKKMLFNSRPRSKVRFNMHTQKERKEASALFRRVYAIAYRAIQQKNWMLFAEKYGVMWGLWHAAGLEKPPLTRLRSSWYKAIDEIKRLAISSGYERF